MKSLRQAQGFILDMDGTFFLGERLLPGALEYAHLGFLTGGAGRNRSWLQDHVRVETGVSSECEHVLYDPQTSGGLLIAVAPERHDSLLAEMARHDTAAWTVGEVVAGQGLILAD